MTDEIQVYRTDTFEKVAVIPVGDLPHGLWPSGDGTRLYIGLENADGVAVIDTLQNQVVTTIAIGQAPQALVYVPQAVLSGDGTQNLQPLGQAGAATHLTLANRNGEKLSTVAVFEQGITQILQAAVTGLAPMQAYTLALAARSDGQGPLEPLANFTTNPAGAAIVNAVGPIRQLIETNAAVPHRFLVVAPVTDGKVGAPVQVQE